MTTVSTSTNITRDREQLINQVSSLDFFDIRNNIINFLKNQTEFTDYNFEGSNLSILLDVLAYYTFYKGFYLDAHISEMFLGTAVQRAAAVARAKQMGYVPNSVRSATADLTLNLVATSGTPLNIPVPAGTKFIVQQNGARFTFTLRQNYVAYPNLSNPSVYSVDVIPIEGQIITDSVTINSTNGTLPILLDNQNIDTTTIQVSVLPTSGASPSSATPFSLSTDFVTLTGSSNVYFLEEIENLRYQIYFGDGVLGRALNTGNVVNISYLVSSGDSANGASTFALSTPISGASLSNVSGFPGVVVNSNASGGAAIESVDSIKLNTPLLWQSQQRGVTNFDISSLLKKNFSYIKAISVWGGENNAPLALGYTFISATPNGVGQLYLTDQQKSDIETYLANRYSVNCIIPIVVDPDFVYIDVDTVVIYNPLTQTNPGNLQSLITQNIINFNSTFFDFGKYFKYSNMVTMIDSSDPTITNSLSTIRLEKRAQISNQALDAYSLNYYNGIAPNTVSSGEFVYTVSTFSIVNAGSAYIVGDVVELSAPGFTVNPKVQITQVGGSGQILATIPFSAGWASAATDVAPVTDVACATSGGTGIGATITVSSANYSHAKLGDALLPNGTGVITVSYIPTSSSTRVPLPNIAAQGTINYTTGTILLDAFSVAPTASTVLPMTQLSVTAEPAINDVYSTTNALLVIDSNSVTVSTQPDTTISA